MPLRKLLSLFLALALLTSILCGCDSKNGQPTYNEPEKKPTNSPTVPDTPDEPDAPTIPSTPGDPSVPDVPESPTNKIVKTLIRDADNFSEGLAFVKKKYEYTKTYCINKNGEIVFTLDGDYHCSTFHNGIAFLCKYNSDAPDDIFICDTEGNLTSPADLGASAFVEPSIGFYYTPYDYFFGDYVLVIKSTNTFSGSTDELGILNCDLEYIVEPNAELYKLFFNMYDPQHYDYYDGYLYLNSRYLDLRTGEEGFDMDSFNENMQHEFQSDTWYYNSSQNSNTYKDAKDSSTKIDLSQYNQTLYNAGKFENGTAPLFFCSDNATNSEYYFTILGEDGQFKFEPAVLPTPDQNTKYSYACSENTYVLYENSPSNTGQKLTVLVFNESGLLSQSEFDLTSGSISISDGVIIVHDFSEARFYNLNLEPLF